jgi:DNA-binding transcriptional regulator YiaG
MTGDELQAQIDAIGLTQASFGRLIAVNIRTVRRWRSGESPVPMAVRVLIDLLQHPPALARATHVSRERTK